VDQFEASPILGTNNGLRPFFSPDGQSIGYFTGTALGALMTVPVAGGKPVVLCDKGGFYGGTWGEDGTIVYSGAKGLMRVAASGGMCQPVTNADSEKGEAHRWPQFLPGSQAVVFTIGAQRSFDSAQIAVLDLKTGQQHVVVNGGSAGRYVPSGHLVYVRGGTMFAVPFDAKRLQTTGAETQIIDGLYYNGGGGFADYAFSNFGLLVYAARDQGSNPRPLEWVDRGGNRLPLPATEQEYLGMHLSPDGRSAALEYGMAGAGVGGSSDIWTYELTRGAEKKLTSEGVNNHPLWTPDGQRVAFHSGSGPATSGIYQVSANAGGKQEKLISSVEAVPDSWTQDGKTLLYTQRVAARSRIWAVELAGVGGPKSEPRPLLDDSAFDESDAQVSPDGHWVAYTSDESGKNQVYVRPFHGPGNVVSVSIEGGQEPRWPRDGRELFYRDAGKGQLMVVAVQTSPALGVSRPRALFAIRTPFWDVAPDGKRFLAVKEGGITADETKLRVVDNWFDELRRKVPTGK
jgi:serine/threonine-protein kinase